MPAIRLADRLLAEWVRRREEAAGHPQDCSEADAAGIRAGGDLAARIVERARALPGSDARLALIRRLLRAARVLAGLCVVVAGLAGAAAASSALSASTPASLPLVLLVVVSFNLLTLLLWLVLQPLSDRMPPGLGALLDRLSLAYARRIAGGGDADTASLLRTLSDGGLGRWYAAAVVHAAWLAFAVGAALALALLLSVRAYALSWETTLLDDAALTTWARVFSICPALFGIAGAETLPVTEANAARQGWSLWLLAASVVYGVLPRALALAASLFMLWRSQRALAGDLSRPGFARLRARLLPDHAELGTVDPAPPAPVPTAARAAPPAVLQGRVHGLSLEGDAGEASPVLPGVDWVWLGSVDDATSRAAVLHQLRDDTVDALAICVRATLTPDRGIERFVAELASAARAPTTLLLDGLDRLRARGEAAFAQRIDDWRQLAQRCGVAILHA
ncbi:DUF2868 domain-containing protein [Sinimarinibacterium thermocellulolyticum]|uniref:DUF2868 domain-containing protein n=1 Tax=Sinimarinibacterium thermocellulolyticum TaxID=3170016 RepID=A0ABV2A832_9GAMM